MPQRRPQRRRERYSVFLNIPYDSNFESLFLAYIAGLSALGLVPRATLEIPSSRRRLERILLLMDECRYSIHDLSRVQLNRTKPRTPRFNMPFELGLAVARDAIRRQEKWYVYETVRYRVNKSLSDLDGTDVHIHGGTIRGVLAALGNVFVRQGQQPSIRQMYRVYLALRANLGRILREAGAKDPFNARVFRDLVFAARISGAVLAQPPDSSAVKAARRNTSA